MAQVVNKSLIFSIAKTTLTPWLPNLPALRPDYITNAAKYFNIRASRMIKLPMKSTHMWACRMDNRWHEGCPNFQFRFSDMGLAFTFNGKRSAFNWQRNSIRYLASNVDVMFAIALPHSERYEFASFLIV